MITPATQVIIYSTLNNIMLESEWVQFVALCLKLLPKHLWNRNLASKSHLMSPHFFHDDDN